MCHNMFAMTCNPVRRAARLRRRARHRGAAAAPALLLALACTGGAQEPISNLVISSDPELAELAAALLPDIAARSGLELREPVRLERRSREELVRYLEYKLDAELPEAEAKAMVSAYALLGLVPHSLDLREVLLSLYTEQVAGFYEPDSTALFVMDDQPEMDLQGLLVHELVHAVQDQWFDLDALTDSDLGNDRAAAAQAAIEGHATLVMFEFMAEQATGAPVDLGQLPDFAAQLRPALEGMRTQFPALAGAPAVIQEALLFPYLEGAGYVLRLWAAGNRVAPFGDFLPASTEQIVLLGGSAPPVELSVSVTGGRLVHEDVLGHLELSIFLQEHVGAASASLADGWAGDRYVLVETASGDLGLVWQVIWDDAVARDGFADALDGALNSLGGPATLERTDIEGRPATQLSIGITEGVSVVTVLDRER